jgi:hypothetical protein
VIILQVSQCIDEMSILEDCQNPHVDSWPWRNGLVKLTGSTVSTHIKYKAIPFPGEIEKIGATNYW